ncbi:MAG: NADH-quinone oxidoreductase subunit NuoB [Deltaproteobacteria bacterium]|nr:NADH-quinone oxidoreductase subunit NuoB [Deltaproteobacteria bacterium]
MDESDLGYEHPLYKTMLAVPGLSVATGSLDQLLEWGMRNSLWVFPMATSCCGIELMAAAASRVDLDRMGTIVRATPRQSDVMVIAGTITVKMAPRVKALWDQMPEPKWAIAMGSCAISGDFYRNLYSVVPGIDTIIPVDVYIPGCPPNPEALMHGLLRLQEKIKARRHGKPVAAEPNPTLLDITRPSIGRFVDPSRDPALNEQQITSALEASSLDGSDEPKDGEAEPTIAEYEPVSIPGAQERAPELEAILAELGVTELPKDGAPIVAADRHYELARRLRAAGYRQLVYVVATHFAAKAGKAPSPERFEVAYALRTVGKGSRLAAWRVQLEPGQSVTSLVGVFAGADWQEREQFDLVGVRFDGHPDLRRIMLPETWEGHPLRKDFPADKACPPWR